MESQRNYPNSMERGPTIVVQACDRAELFLVSTSSHPHYHQAPLKHGRPTGLVLLPLGYTSQKGGFLSSPYFFLGLIY